MSKIRRLVLDVVKPMEPSIVEYAKKLSALKGVSGVNVSLLEIDKKVENVRLTLMGPGIELDSVIDVVESLGGAVHSIDEVAAGREIVEHAVTLEEM